MTTGGSEEDDDGGGSGHPGRTESARPYPVVLSLAGRACLVVGGGPVGVRRAEGLLESGALVTVVALRADPALAPLADTGAIVLEERAYRPGEAAHYEFVVTATGDPSVDAAVLGDASAAGVLVNSADTDRPGTVQLPAVIRRGTVTVAVATGGASPALAGWLADRIAASLPPRLATVAALVEEARATLRASGRPTGSVAWGDLIDSVVLPLVENDRIDEARVALRDACQHPEPGAGGSGSEWGRAPQ